MTETAPALLLRLFSPAKLNLALQVTGRRADGYHMLDSLVVSADVMDVLHLSPAPAWCLRVFGPKAEGVPEDGRNLLLKAAQLASRFHPGAPTFAIHLEKNLPHGAGLGGGSMNAAVLLRGLAQAWRLNADWPVEAGWPQDALLSLGTDLPACLRLGREGALRMRGTGERLTPLPRALPPLHAVLVHPGEGLATPAVYAACRAADHAPALPETLPDWAEAADFAHWLVANTTNALQPAAMRLSGAIAAQIAALRTTEACLLARMSGSGSACFGLYAKSAEAEAAMRALAAGHPEWWVRACRLGLPAAMLQDTPPDHPAGPA